MTKRKSTALDDDNVQPSSSRKSLRSARSQPASAGHAKSEENKAINHHADDNTERLSPQTPKVDQAKYIQVTEKIGDIFAAPPCSVIIHACNCEGHWGAGIAKAFKDRHPEAYSVYHDHCIQANQSDLRGTAFLIPPQTSSDDEDEVTANHFIGCLFTSRSKGRTKDSPTKILANTGPAFEHLLRQITEWNAKDGDEVKAGELWMCQINSGLFKVPWEKTRRILEQIEVKNTKVVTVVERDRRMTRNIL